MIDREQIYNPGFDETEGLTESPDIDAARVALVEAQSGVHQTDSVIAESQGHIATLRQIRLENHFTQKIRRIIQTPRSA
jgi:hypothetical protein